MGHHSRACSTWPHYIDNLLTGCAGIASGSLVPGSSPSGQSQSRASPRPRPPQPQGPPDRDARGFTLGRGRALPPPPGAGPVAASPPAPGTRLPPTAPVPAVNSHTTATPVQLDTSAAAWPPSHHAAAAAAAAKLGHQLLAQLQGQPGAAAKTDLGTDLGRGLLQQLQQAAGSSRAQHQQGGIAQASLPHPDAAAASQPGSLSRPAPELLPQPPQQSHAATVSFQDLLRGAAASQQPRQLPNAAPFAAHSFNQLLRGAATSPQAPSPEQPQQPGAPSPRLGHPPFRQRSAPHAGIGTPTQLHPVAPPPGLAGTTQPVRAAATAAPFAAADIAAAAVAAFGDNPAAAAGAGGNPGRLLLQQLQQQQRQLSGPRHSLSQQGAGPSQTGHIGGDSHSSGSLVLA